MIKTAVDVIRYQQIHGIAYGDILSAIASCTSLFMERKCVAQLILDTGMADNEEILEYLNSEIRKVLFL